MFICADMKNLNLPCTLLWLEHVQRVAAQCKSIAQEELHGSFQEEHNDVALVDDGKLLLVVVVGYTAAARFASNEFVLPPLIEICHKISWAGVPTHGNAHIKQQRKATISQAS